MKQLHLTQGSPEWLVARLWRLTASNMSNVITSTGKLSKSEAAMKHIDKMIAGLALKTAYEADPESFDEEALQGSIAHYTGDTFSGNIHTRRGNDMEQDAIDALEVHIDEGINRIGMCIMGDDENGVVSCSPDGVIYDSLYKIVTGAEVKCHQPLTSCANG